MEKPKKYHQSILEFAKKSSFIKAAHYMMGYNRGVEESDKYYKRYIKKKCVKKKDLPTVEEIHTILTKFAEDWDNDRVFSIIEKDFGELAQTLAKRIGKEG